MGGQACVLYGAAEFSRDIDLAVLAETENLTRLSAALAELDAVVVAVPPFDATYLRKGHAVHFRCRHPDAAGFRIDVMARLRGLDPFEQMWARRTSLTLDAATAAAPATDVEVLSLPDLVLAKKTQRDKDWPMLRRLLEADYSANRLEPGVARVAFWLRELRTPELLIAVAHAWPDVAAVEAGRLAVRSAVAGDVEAVESALAAEQRSERDLDREWWAPLRAELEMLRRTVG